MESLIGNCEDESNLRSKTVQIRLMGHCIICLRKVSAKRIQTSKNFRATESLKIAPKSVVSSPGFLATFNQLWTVVQTKWKEKKDGNDVSEGIEISLENVLQKCTVSNVNFSKPPTICRLCCDKILAVENLMKAVRQQVREISILLEEGRRRHDGASSDFEKSLREKGLEESVIKTTLEFVGIFDGIKSQADLQVSIDDHVSPAPPDIVCVISGAESVEEHELGSSQVDRDEDIDDYEGQTMSGTENDDDDDPDYLKEEPEEADNSESTIDEDGSEEEMENDEDDDKNDPDFKVREDPLALLAVKRRRDKKDTVEDDTSNFPCSCGRTFTTFKKLRDHMRKDVKNHLEYKPFNFKKPNDPNGSEDKEDDKETLPCTCGKIFLSRRSRGSHIRKNKELHPDYKPYMNVEGRRRPTCELCGEKVVFGDLFQHYVQDHFNGHVEWILKCPNKRCHYFGPTLNKLSLHLRRAQYKECNKIWKEMGGPVCDTCGLKGTNMFKIRCHVKAKHENGNEKKLKCPISGCGKMFCVRQSVHFHLQEHRQRPITRQTCDKCEESVKMEEMEGHLKDKHGILEVIVCTQCEMKFSGRDEMIEHLFEHRESGIFCDICEQDKFTKYSDFREHYFMVHKLCPKKYKCGEEGDCDVWFWRKEMKKDHELRMHKESNASLRYRESLVKSRGKDFKCDVCNLKLVNEDVFMNHNIRFHGADPFRCDICGETFHLKRLFNKHMREHAGIVFQKEWKCEVEDCVKIFRNKSLWKHHTEIGHTEERPHVCEECGKGFTFASSLRGHRDSVHLGLRPWVCEDCGEGFSSSTILKRHKLIHTGERPFGCEICGQRFRHKEVLQRHLKSHEKKGDDFKPNGPMKQIRKRKAQ